MFKHAKTPEEAFVLQELFKRHCERPAAFPLRKRTWEDLRTRQDEVNDRLQKRKYKFSNDKWLELAKDYGIAIPDSKRGEAGAYINSMLMRYKKLYDKNPMAGVSFDGTIESWEKLTEDTRNTLIMEYNAPKSTPTSSSTPVTAVPSTPVTAVRATPATPATPATSTVSPFIVTPATSTVSPFIVPSTDIHTPAAATLDTEEVSSETHTIDIKLQANQILTPYVKTPTTEIRRSAVKIVKKIDEDFQKTLPSLLTEGGDIDPSKFGDYILNLISDKNEIVNVKEHLEADVEQSTPEAKTQFQDFKNIVESEVIKAVDEEFKIPLLTNENKQIIDHFMEYVHESAEAEIISKASLLYTTRRGRILF